jgi:hypothetical protein
MRIFFPGSYSLAAATLQGSEESEMRIGQEEIRRYREAGGAEGHGWFKGHGWPKEGHGWPNEGHGWPKYHDQQRQTSREIPVVGLELS